MFKEGKLCLQGFTGVTFDGFDHSTDGVFRRDNHMDVEMVSVDTDLDIFPVWVILTRFLQFDFEIVVYSLHEYLSSVFGHPHNVVLRPVNTVTGFVEPHTFQCTGRGGEELSSPP